MSRIAPQAFVALLALGCLPSVRGASLRKVWEISLQGMGKAAGRETNRAGVTAIRFSPDGAMIAVGIARHSPGNGPSSGLAIFDTKKPNLGGAIFPISDAGSDSEDRGVVPPAISWSPAGDLILAGYNVLQPKSGGMCKLPANGGAGLLGESRIVALDLGSPARFKIFDSDCRLIDTWEIDGEWIISDVSAERGLIGALKKTSGQITDWPEALLVIDPSARTVVRSWLTSKTGYAARFADHGDVLCATGGGGSIYHADEIAPRCMDVNTGKILAEAPTVKGGFMMAAADHGTRVVASDHRNMWNLLHREYDDVLKRRVIWDFRTNVEIVSWNPETQTYEIPTLKKPLTVREPFAFAISPDGEYIAEGGNGMLRLYRIEL